MKLLNKSAALLLALCLLFSLAACKDANVEDTTPAKTEPAATQPAETEPAGTQPTDETGDVVDIAGQVECVPGTVTEKLVYIDEEMTGDDPRLNEVFASCGDVTITNREFQIYFWMEYINTIQTYGDYLAYFGLDTSVAPAEQICTLQENPITWEHFFINAGLDRFREQAAVVSKANAEGFTVADMDAQLRDAMDTLQVQAQNYGFSSINALLQASFGPGITKSDYENYLKLYFTMLGYKQKLMNEMEFSDEELEEYYLDNIENETFSSIGTDHPDINVRHILIKTEDEDGDGAATEEEWAAAEQKAKDILAEFEKDPTEEHFAELAGTYSDDTGSNTNGGLYEEIYPGWSVQPFNDWCFDDARKPGDVGMVKVDDRYQGYHIIYYVEQLDSYYWKAAVKEALADENMYGVVDSIRENYPVDADYSKLSYGPPVDTEVAG